MHITVSTRRAPAVSTDLLVLATTRAELKRDLAGLDPALKAALQRTIARTKFTAADNTTLSLQTHRLARAALILIVGVDPTKAPRTWHYLADAAIREARAAKAASVAIAFGGTLLSNAALAAVTEGLLLSAYTFERFKSRPRRGHRPARVQLLIHRDTAQLRAAVERAQLFAGATCYARDLTMTPAADMTPSHLAAEAMRLARQHHLRARIAAPRALKRLRMGALLGVARGSAQPPRFIELIYKPRRPAKQRIAIVGKGITFDSGGLSLKHSDAMQGQKRDMAGGAAVLAVMSVIAQLAPAVEVRGYVPATENMPGGRAIKPGDVVRAYNGKTIEVLNTDAEGRLVLADALSYAAAAKPDVMIDLATLTAAVGAALGRRYAGLMSTNAALAQALIDAGRRAGEHLWELPLVEEYRADINSQVADIKNTGEGSAGTIIGGLFLREFVGRVPWAHIDFSSTVMTEKAFPAHPQGATGFGVRTLLHYITGL